MLLGVFELYRGWVMIRVVTIEPRGLFKKQSTLFLVDLVSSVRVKISIYNGAASVLKLYLTVRYYTDFDSYLGYIC